MLYLLYMHTLSSLRPLGLCMYIYIYIYQAKHLSLWYKCYVPHCLCRLIARQYELEQWIYYIDSLGNFNYGSAHVSSNHVLLTFVNKKWANPMEIMEVLISN